MSERVLLRMRPIGAEIREMERIGLYTSNECKMIVVRQEHFEYKINGTLKKLDDYKEYIEYLKALLKQITLRRNKSKVGEKVGSIEFKISKRIQNLYEDGLERFCDFTFCCSYVQFCHKLKFLNVRSIEKILAKYSANPSIFRVIAKWYLSERKDSGAALKILNRGLVFHKDDINIFKDIIELELQTHSEPDKRVEKYVSYILPHVIEASVLIDLLNIIENKKCPLELQQPIVNKLIAVNSHLAIAWHTLAKREYNGLHFEEKPSSKSKYVLCVEKYKEGLKHVKSKQRAILKAYFVNFLLASLETEDDADLSDLQSIFTESRKKLPTNLRNIFQKDVRNLQPEEMDRLRDAFNQVCEPL